MNKISQINNINKQEIRKQFHFQVFKKLVWNLPLNNKDRELFKLWKEAFNPNLDIFDHYRDKRVLYEIVKYLGHKELCLNENIRWIYASKIEYLLKMIYFYRGLEHKGKTKKGEITNGLTFYCGLADFSSREAPPFNPKEKRKWSEEWIEGKKLLDKIISYNFGLDIDGKDFKEAYSDAKKVFNLFNKFKVRFSIWCSGKKGFHCLPAQEKILVKYQDRIRLCDLRWLDKIIKEGNEAFIKSKRGFVKVTETFRRKVNQNERLVKLETRGFLSYRLSEYHKQPILRKGEEKLVLAKDIMISDMLPISTDSYEGSIEGTYSLGRFIGLYLAEGHRLKRNKTISFTFNRDEQNYAEFIKVFANDLGAIVKIKLCHNCIRVRIHSHTIFSLLEDYIVGDNAKSKGFNCKIYGMSREFREGIIDGWLEGDGLHGQYQAGTTASKGLAKSLQMLGLTVGRLFTSYARIQKVKGVSRKYYHLWWIKDPVNSDAIKYDLEKKIYYVKIRRKCYYKNKIDLIDLNVESKDHIFAIARGLLTHNCIIPYDEFSSLVEPFDLDYTISFCKSLMLDLVKHLKLKKVDTLIYSSLRYLKCPYTLDRRNGRVIYPLSNEEFVDFNEKMMSREYLLIQKDLGNRGVYINRLSNPQGFENMIKFLEKNIK